MGWELAQDLERQKEKGKAFQGRVGGREQGDSKGRERDQYKPVCKKTLTPIVNKDDLCFIQKTLSVYCMLASELKFEAQSCLLGL